MPATNARSRALAASFGGAAALAAAMGIGRFVYTPILPQMADALSLSKSAAGLIAAANFLGYLAGALFAALPQLAGARRAWVLGALCMVAATTAGMALGESTTSFLWLRLVCGVASAIVLVQGSALVTEELASLGHREFSAVHFAGVGAGVALSTAVLAVLEFEAFDWRALWLAAGALAALAVVAFAVLAPRDHHKASASGATPVQTSTSAQRAGLAWLYVSYGLFGLGYVITATFLVSAMASTARNPMPGLFVWFVVGLTAVPSIAVWSVIGRRYGALPTYFVACLVESCGVAVGGLFPGVTGALIAAVLLGATFMALTALGFEAARGIAPHRQRQAFAIMTACFGAGQILGPLLAGGLMDRTHSFVAASLLGAGALLVSGGCALLALQASRANRAA